MMAKTKSTTTDSTKNIEVSFRPRARIMRTLGRELISNETVAIIELVKNAYDADATRVLIRFSGSLEKGKGTIEVIDNGHGMSLATVEDAWMEPATNSKRKNRKSEQLKRSMLGEKGVGRFACARLANELELITRRSTNNREIYAIFDWTQFDNENLYLEDIEILAEHREPMEICPGGRIEELWGKDRVKKVANSELTHGTILKMNGLNKTWNSSDFENLQRDLSRLISPFEQFSDFRITLDLPDEFAEYSKEITPPEIIKYPHYTLKGTVNGDGTYNFKVRIPASGLKKDLTGQFLRGVIKSEIALRMFTREQAKSQKEDLSEEEFEERKIRTGPLDIELRIWDRDELDNIIQKTESTLRDIRRDLDALAGVNIYRDGFRVLPYGEPTDDWLELNLRRVQKPTKRLSNNQIVGFILISLENNPELRDQSNREGLDDNQAFSDLKAVLLLLLNYIEEIRYPLRERKSKKPLSKPIQGLFSALNLENLRSQLLEKYPQDKDTQQLVDQTEKALSDQIDEIQVVITRYQRLATLGTLIDVILHDGRHPLAAIIQQSILGQEDTADGKNISDVSLSSLNQRFKKIETQGNLLDTVFDRIEPFGGRRRGRPTQLYLEEIIRSAISVFHADIQKLGVDISLSQSQTLVRVDESEIQQVVLNLLQNSLYWLEYTAESKRRIIIKVSRVAEDHVEIVFADSGPGIPRENRDLIFDPYFSTKPNGVGLGLTIAGEIVSDYYNGKLELIDSSLLPGAVFLVTLKKRV